MEPHSRSTHEPAPTPPAEPGPAELAGEVAAHAKNLMKLEIELARTELENTLSKVTRNGIVVASAALLGLYSLGFLLLSVMFAIGRAIPLGAAALLVAIVVVLIAGSMALVGWQRLKKTDLEPKRTVRTLEADVKWAGQQIS
jgi:hypothetical protein